MLSAAVAESNRGAFVDWCREVGVPTSRRAFMDAAVRGRRYRALAPRRWPARPRPLARTARPATRRRSADVCHAAATPRRGRPVRARRGQPRRGRPAAGAHPRVAARRLPADSARRRRPARVRPAGAGDPLRRAVPALAAARTGCSTSAGSTRTPPAPSPAWAASQLPGPSRASTPADSRPAAPRSGHAGRCRPGRGPTQPAAGRGRARARTATSPTSRRRPSRSGSPSSTS